MSAVEENAADDKRSHPPAHDAPEDEPDKAESWLKRLKHRLASKLAKMLGSAIARIQGWKARLGESEEASEDRPRAKVAHPAPPKVEIPPAAEVEPSAKKPHKLRNVLIVIVLILASGGVGAGAAYSLLSRLLKDQSLAIESHEQEVRASQLNEQEQGKKLAEMLRELEAERKLRSDMEARLVDVEQGRLAAEARQKQTNTEVAKSESPGKPDVHPQKEAEIDLKVVGRPSKASTFRPPAAGNCNLAGSDPAALKRCVEEYNRK